MGSSSSDLRLIVIALALTVLVGCDETRTDQAASTPDPDMPAVPIPHLGQGASVLASSTHRGGPGEGPPAFIVDGDPATCWSSADADDQEVTIDLKSVKHIARLHLMWGKAAAKVYTVQVSPNGFTWSVPISTTSGSSGPRIDEIPLNVDVQCLRIGLKVRSRPGGFTLNEVVILGR